MGPSPQPTRRFAQAAVPGGGGPHAAGDTEGGCLRWGVEREGEGVRGPGGTLQPQSPEEAACCRQPRGQVGGCSERERVMSGEGWGQERGVCRVLVGLLRLASPQRRIWGYNTGIIIAFLRPKECDRSVRCPQTRNPYPPQRHPTPRAPRWSGTPTLPTSAPTCCPRCRSWRPRCRLWPGTRRRWVKQAYGNWLM